MVALLGAVLFGSGTVWALVTGTTSWGWPNATVRRAENPHAYWAHVGLLAAVTAFCVWSAARQLA